MGEYQFVGMLVAAIASLAGVITPILKLNASIVRLTALLETLQTDLTKADRKIDEHTDAINHLNMITQDHDTRIKHLEGSNNVSA